MNCILHSFLSFCKIKYCP